MTLTHKLNMVNSGDYPTQIEMPPLVVYQPEACKLIESGMQAAQQPVPRGLVKQCNVSRTRFLNKHGPRPKSTLDSKLENVLQIKSSNITEQTVTEMIRQQKHQRRQSAVGTAYISQLEGDPESPLNVAQPANRTRTNVVNHKLRKSNEHFK
jgi:hypothetical protein